VSVKTPGGKIDRRTTLKLFAGSGTMLAAGIGAASRVRAAPPADEPLSPSASPDPSEMIDLWPNGAPGMPASPPEESIVQRSTDPQLSDRFVTGITRPRMTVFRPRVPNGAAGAEAVGAELEKRSRDGNSRTLALRSGRTHSPRGDRGGRSSRPNGTCL